MSYGYNPGNNLNTFQIDPIVLPQVKTPVPVFNNGLINSKNALFGGTLNQFVTYNALVDSAYGPTMAMVNTVGIGREVMNTTNASNLMQNTSSAMNKAVAMNVLPTYTAVIEREISTPATTNAMATFSQSMGDWTSPTAISW